MSAAARSLAAIWQSFRLAVSQERVWLMALPVVTGLMTALLAPGYGDTYASPEDLARAVASAQVSDTSRFLYGDLSASAGIVQVAAWELGGLTCLVLSVVISLRSISLTRAAEDLGRTELLRSTGTGPAAGLVGQGLTLALQCLFLGIGAGAGLLALEEADGTDAVTYGAVLTATCLTVSFAALVVAQLAPDAAAGRSIALGVVGLMYSGNGMRASKHWDWAGWVSPFRLRTEADPGGDNSWPPHPHRGSGRHRRADAGRGADLSQGSRSGAGATAREALVIAEGKWTTDFGHQAQQVPVPGMGAPGLARGRGAGVDGRRRRRSGPAGRYQRRVPGGASIRRRPGRGIPEVHRPARRGAVRDPGRVPGVALQRG